ncbi:MAG: hypothetical protein JW892_14350 [Anaerolineae bacterium]|nr:hypothetical protein [Anaerolineae bacterium]
MTVKVKIDLTDAEGLAANQRGELTNAQRERAIRAARGRRGCLTHLLRRVFLPAGALMALVFLLGGRAPALVVWVLLFIALVVGTEMFMLTVPPLIQRQQLLRRDLVEERLESAEGRLLYARGGYEAVVDNRVLLLPSDPPNLRPDMLYRFYFLPRSGFVLSAELVGKAATADTRAALLEAFSAVFDFDKDALDANRRGQLTPRQQLRLLPGLITVAGDFTPRQLWSDLIQGRIEATEGIGRRLKQPRPYQPYTYLIGARHFVVPARAFEVLIDEWPYRVYHTPRSGILLSIEPLAARHDSGNRDAEEPYDEVDSVEEGGA